VIGHTYKIARTIYWKQATTWRILKFGGVFSATDLKLLEKSGYKISLRIGGLFLSVVHNPLPQARVALFINRHIPLYPRWSHPVSWLKADKAWPTNMDRRLIAFNQMLSLAIADWDQYPKSRNINDPTMWQPAMKGPSEWFDPDGRAVHISELRKRHRHAKP
jgi:hypothetical protein